jgi:type I restriction enzyme M protein
VIALPQQLFYTTQIPVCIWILSKSKKVDTDRNYRAREGETLFIDARDMGSMISRRQKELSYDELTQIASIFHNWRGGGEGSYEDIPGLCKSATLEEVKSHDYMLTPGRYVGAAEVDDDGEPFEEKMERLVDMLGEQMSESNRLNLEIREMLGEIGHDL